MKKTGDEESVFQFQDFSHLMSAGGKSPDYEKEEENKTIRDVLQSGIFFPHSPLYISRYNSKCSFFFEIETFL